MRALLPKPVGERLRNPALPGSSTPVPRSPACTAVDARHRSEGETEAKAKSEDEEKNEEPTCLSSGSRTAFEL